MLTPEQYPPIIKSFEITGLYGDRDIQIDFDSSIKILVGENGTGKTTILNALYGVVNVNFTALIDLDFQTLEVDFRNQTISIKKN